MFPLQWIGSVFHGAVIIPWYLLDLCLVCLGVGVSNDYLIVQDFCSWEALIHVCASCRLVGLVGVEVEMRNIGRLMNRHVLKWRKQNETLTVVGKESLA